MIEEKNREFEKKMKVNQLLIETLMWKNVKKEAFVESQKNKSNSYSIKMDQLKK